LDIPLTTVSVGLAVWGNYLLQNMEPDAEEKPKEDLLPWDRPFAGVWNPAAATASNVLAGLAAVPLVLGGGAWARGEANGRDFATLALMYAQVMAIQSGVNLAVRSLKIWKRPFLLGNDGGSARQEGEAHGSFYSGHASAAFATAVFLGVYFQNLYPGSRYTPAVWAGGLSLAVLVSSLRVAAGKHYPTDVIVGGLMGSLISYGVLKLHESKDQNTNLTASPGGLYFSYSF
jgi:membrane-associated phospholipid phosphatase